MNKTGFGTSLQLLVVRVYAMGDEIKQTVNYNISKLLHRLSRSVIGAKKRNKIKEAFLDKMKCLEGTWTMGNETIPGFIDLLGSKYRVQ